jgi:hypothetical protein
MKNIIYILLLTSSLMYSQEKVTKVLSIDDVRGKIIKNKIYVDSKDLKVERRIIVISDKDTVSDVRKRGRIQYESTFKDYPLVLQVYTYNKNGGWVMKSTFYWEFTMYYKNEE